MARKLLGLALAASAALAPSRQAAAQVEPDSGAGDQLRRESRIRDLQRLELDRRLRANRDVPPGQRVLFDYGGYVTANFLDLDDPEGDDHILREYDGIGYVRLNVDGAQEFF